MCDWQSDWQVFGSFWNMRKERQEMAVLDLYERTDTEIASPSQVRRCFPPPLFSPLLFSSSILPPLRSVAASTLFFPLPIFLFVFFELVIISLHSSARKTACNRRTWQGIKR